MSVTEVGQRHGWHVTRSTESLIVRCLRLLSVLSVAAVLALAIVGGGCVRRRMGPNDAYHDPRVAAEGWRQLFEGDDREIYRKRDLIMKLAAPRPGMSVADVGAGTGLFTMMLSDAVGADGRVYAEEVLEKFSRFIAERAAHEKRSNVVSVMGTETGIGLPPGSIDLAFACDVYHHFDRPQEMLASIWRALRVDGELFLVDFSRVPGQSPAWILEHVRAGEVEVLREIETSGFVLLSSDHSIGINYALRFRRSEEISR
jgi:SAM-dependent methyltransferase